MTQLLGSVQGQVAPERRIIEVLGTGGGERFIPDYTQRRLCYAADDWLYLMSVSGWGHEAVVTLEAWDGEPPADPAAEASESVRVRLSEGGVYVSRNGEAAVSPVLEAGPGGEYAVRVDVSGRAALQQADDDPDRPDWIYGVERFTVRFWPIGQ